MMNIIMLNANVLNAVMLNVAFLSVIMVLRQFIEINRLCKYHFNGDWRGYETILLDIKKSIILSFNFAFQSDLSTRQ
jgi:hypothetical protein